MTKKRPHINHDGLFQSDKYPTCPPGKVPLSVKDPTAQDLLWEYAQRRRAVDAEFADDLEYALREADYKVVDDIEMLKLIKRSAIDPRQFGQSALGVMDRAISRATMAALSAGYATKRDPLEDPIPVAQRVLAGNMGVDAHDDAIYLARALITAHAMVDRLLAHVEGHRQITDDERLALSYAVDAIDASADSARAQTDEPSVDHVELLDRAVSVISRILGDELRAETRRISHEPQVVIKDGAYVAMKCSCGFGSAVSRDPGANWSAVDSDKALAYHLAAVYAAGQPR